MQGRRARMGHALDPRPIYEEGGRDGTVVRVASLVELHLAFKEPNNALEPMNLGHRE